MLTLALRRTESAQGATVARFLPGDDVAAWLDEVSRWGVPLERLRFYLCPLDVRNEAVGGVLVVPPEGAELPRNGCGIPFRRAGRSVYLPTESILWPPVTTEELGALARFPVTIFHPVFGLTGCEDEDVRQAWELLSVPPMVSEDWTRARHGPTSPPVLKIVHLAASLTLDAIFGPESEDIGSETPENLPPLPEETSDAALARIARGVTEGLAKTLLGLTSFVPRKRNGRRTWINELESWAQRRLSGITADLDRSRHRELHRLLELLKNEPESGLRYAIPLTALAHRGNAAPSGRLGQRSVDFSLGRLGGGRAADFWNIPGEMRTSFARHYRELAMREIRLGRHRRAAYIFAELLGDLNAAADALRQGRHFHEAAVLYRERLHNPLAAASCLAEAGLFHEAVELYEAHRHWLEAADIYVCMGDAVAAENAVRREVNAKLEADDVVAAARLVDQRLDRVDEALHLLREAWPRGKQAVSALEERFALLQRRQLHNELRRDLKAVAHESTPAALLSATANFMAKLAEESPDRELRELAVNAVRIKVATALTGRLVEGSDEMALLRALTRIAPGDKVLIRDVQRFRDSRRAAPTQPTSSSSTSLIRRIVVPKIGTQQLGAGAKWIRAVGDALGYTTAALTADRRILVTKGSWGGGEESVAWPDPAPERGRSMVVATHLNRVIVGRPMAPRLAPQSVVLMGNAEASSVQIGTPEFLPEDTVAVAASRFSVWALRVVQDRIVLDGYESQSLVATTDVTDELLAAGATGGGTSLSIAAQLGSGGVALGYGCHLLNQYGSTRKVVDLGARIVGLIALQVPQMPQGWIATLERGASFVSLDGAKIIPIDDHLVQPRVTLTGDHRIVLVGDGEGMVARISGDTLFRLAWFEFEAAANVALIPTELPDVVATLTELGALVRWRIPAS